MENASEALKIAFAVMLFVLALTLSISSFSQANRAVQAITTLRDRESEYTYVKPTRGGNRIVGAETIVPTMYKAYRENIEIIFLDKNGNPLPIYNKIDDKGNASGTINYIDLSKESFGEDGTKTAIDVALEHLAVILSGKDSTGRYSKEIIYHYSSGGFYGYLCNNRRFEERLGEYIQNEGAGEITKRVITYVLIEE